MVGQLLIGGVLLGHAAIHVGFVAPRPPATADGPAWPFSTQGSWLVTRLGVDMAMLRILGIALVALTLAGFALAAMAAVGLASATLWQPSVVIGSLASLALLVVCFDPWLLFGIGIDV